MHKFKRIHERGIVMKIHGPAWLEVEASALAFNVSSVMNHVKQHNEKTKVLAVVKADGYGHGAVECARIMAETGVDYFGVATVYEGIELRTSGLEKPILVLGYTPEVFVEEAVVHDLTLTLYDIQMAYIIEGFGLKHGIKPKVHLKVNTGMSRLGFHPYADSVEEIYMIWQLQLDVEGIFTHLAMADSTKTDPTHQQIEKFNRLVSALEKRDVHIPIKHVCNSPGLMRYPEYHFDMVRAGGILYGHDCFSHIFDKGFLPVRQALSIRAVLANVIEVDEDTGVSYGWLYRTSNRQRIGTISIGYTDGISRRNTNKAEFLIHGKRVKQVGLICMDQMMLDLTAVPQAKMGDVVTLLGADKDHIISLEERAKAAGIGKAELLATIGRRLPKVYKKDGVLYHKINYLISDKSVKEEKHVEKKAM